MVNRDRHGSVKTNYFKKPLSEEDSDTFGGDTRKPYSGARRRRPSSHDQGSKEFGKNIQKFAKKYERVIRKWSKQNNHKSAGPIVGIKHNPVVMRSQSKSKWNFKREQYPVLDYDYTDKNDAWRK